MKNLLKKRLTLRIGENTDEELKDIAWQQRKSKNELIEEILTSWLEINKNNRPVEERPA